MGVGRKTPIEQRAGGTVPNGIALPAIGGGANGPDSPMRSSCLIAVGLLGARMKLAQYCQLFG